MRVGGFVQKQDLHSPGGTGVDKECLSGCKSPWAGGCPPTSSHAQLNSTCTWGRIFPFLPLKMRRGEKKYQRETNEIISAICASVQSPSRSKEQVANSSASVGSDLGSVLKAG